jgi:hypothetical protein
MAPGSPRAWLAILALALVQATDDVVLPKECDCCSQLNTIANEECQTAYKDAGLPENGRCKDWEIVNQPCLEGCVDDEGLGTYPNCTALSSALYTNCFSIMELVNSAEYAKTACTGVTDNFIRRCSVACADKDELCKPGTQINDCMAICGNYRDCNCYDVEGTFMTTCDGAVQEVFLYESCYDILNDPNLTTCRGEGTCVDYSVCPLNKCIVHRVECDPETMCYEAGVCDPSTGDCTYDAKPYGTPCDDDNPFSYTDQCIGYEFERYCAGEMDKCQQFELTCDALNICQGSGSCDADNGDCSNFVLPDGGSCDDGKSWTTNDQCKGGICQGEAEDLCTPLYEEGGCVNEPCVVVTCDPREGVCLRKYLNGNAEQVCGEDGTCVEGRCMTPSPGQYEDIGTGIGTDEEGRSLPGFYGDIGDVDKCLRACDEDPVCIGIGFSISSTSCMLFTPNRTMAPNGERFGGHQVWAWKPGDGRELAKVMQPEAADVPVTMVWKRVEDGPLFPVDLIDVILGPPGIMVALFIIAATYSMVNRRLRKKVLRSLGCQRFSAFEEYLEESDSDDGSGSFWSDKDDKGAKDRKELEDTKEIEDEDPKPPQPHWKYWCVALIVLVALVVLATMVWVVMVALVALVALLVLLAVGGVCLRRYRGAQKTYEEGVEEQLDYEEKMEEEIHARAQEDIAAGYRPEVDSPRSNPDVAAPDRKSDRRRDDEEEDEPDLGPDIPGAVVDDGGGAGSGSSFDTSAKPEP